MKIPYNLNYPKPQKIDGLSGIHGVSSENIVVVDAQTLLIPEFSYDGEAPGKLPNIVYNWKYYYEMTWARYDLAQFTCFLYDTMIFQV